MNSFRSEPQARVVEDGDMSGRPVSRKVTVLDGYHRSGDYECFCFDRLDGPDAYSHFGFDEVGDKIALQDANRVYPNDLLPEGATYGRWVITVEFTSTTEPGNPATPSVEGRL